MRNHNHASRDGFVLPATLLALIVIGAIVTGGFYLSAQEHRVSASSDLGVQAFQVAEYGLQEVMGTWKNRDIADAARVRRTDPTAPLPTREVWAGSRFLGPYTVAIDSLGSRLFAIRVAGTATHGTRSTTRTVGALVRATSAGLPYESAMSVLGTLSVEGQGDIDGTDLCDPTMVVPGVSSPDVGNVTTSGNGEVAGSPNPVVVPTDPVMSQASLSQFGDVSLEDMIASADKIYPHNANPTNMAPVNTTDGAGNAVCDPVLNNWGAWDDTAPCTDYYPIIYAEGDLSLNGSGPSGAEAQGILIVEGDLTIDGNVNFRGVVITKGDLYYAGNGGHVEGSIIVQGSGSSTNAGSSVAAYNSCFIADAFNGALRARPLDSRAWVDLSATAPLPPAS